MPMALLAVGKVINAAISDAVASADAAATTPVSLRPRGSHRRVVLEDRPQHVLHVQDVRSTRRRSRSGPPTPGWWPNAQELSDLKITHDSAGHPTNADFAKLLRRGNAKPEVASWVRKHFSCPDCEANKRPHARRPAATPKTYRFNHVVGIDLVKARNSTTNTKDSLCQRDATL